VVRRGGASESPGAPAGTTSREVETMRLTERSMRRIATDLRAGDVRAHSLRDDVVDDGDQPRVAESRGDQVAHRQWLKERPTTTTPPLERVRFRVRFAGLIWRIPSFGGGS
jgi:hypothetical protein